jgi:hypothetical protein
LRPCVRKLDEGLFLFLGFGLSPAHRFLGILPELFGLCIATLRDNAVAKPAPINGGSLSKIAHSMICESRNRFIFVPVGYLYSPKRRNPPMMKIAFAVAIAAAVLIPAPLLVGTTPAEAQNLKMAQGVDIQIGRDRDRRRNDSDATVGIGPGGVTVGPRQNCRMVTTTIERDGRTITRKERRCD